MFSKFDDLKYEVDVELKRPLNTKKDISVEELVWKHKRNAKKIKQETDEKQN